MSNLMPKGDPLAFQRLWDEDPYAIQRTGALAWLGERYLLAQPINKPVQSKRRQLENA